MAEQGDLSRRGFLKAMGVGGGVLAGRNLVGADPSTKCPATAGPDKVSFSIRVNGTSCDLNVEPRTTLLNALRHHLNLTGPKEVCDRGACGACRQTCRKWQTPPGGRLGGVPIYLFPGERENPDLPTRFPAGSPLVGGKTRSLFFWLLRLHDH